MQSWIFVITAAYDEFKDRINKKAWPIYKNTGNKRKLRVGDNVIFYMGGPEGKKFLGTSRVDSDLIPNSIDFSIGLSDIKIWKKPVLIKDILADLKFIVHKEKWGLHLQGGIIRLSDGDFKTIISNAKKSDV